MNEAYQQLQEWGHSFLEFYDSARLFELALRLDSFNNLCIFTCLLQLPGVTRTVALKQRPYPLFCWFFCAHNFSWFYVNLKIPWIVEETHACSWSAAWNMTLANFTFCFLVLKSLSGQYQLLFFAVDASKLFYTTKNPLSSKRHEETFPNILKNILDTRDPKGTGRCGA